jgi:hypothetical protein
MAAPNLATLQHTAAEQQTNLKEAVEMYKSDMAILGLLLINITDRYKTGGQEAVAAALRECSDSVLTSVAMIASAQVNASFVRAESERAAKRN